MSGHRFCSEVWEKTKVLQEAMLKLPLNLELADGTLSAERFKFYLAQDAIYLLEFARALALTAAKAPDKEDIAFFSGAAQNCIVAERKLHEHYFAAFDLTDQERQSIEASPTCLGYTSFLLATAVRGSFEELMAAVLPCFWVYHNVGVRIMAQQKLGDNNPYAKWIELYAGDEFGADVEICKAAVDRAAQAASADTHERMVKAFTRASEYEWLFWDSAYRLERWPSAHLR